MTVVSVRDALDGTVPVDSQVTVQGWVRTKRDSKHGFSFVNVHDGSCFHSIQVVADATLDNYESDVQRLTAGCAVSAQGRLVASQGRGQSYEIQAQSIEVVGWVEDPDTYPVAAKRHSLEHLRDVAHLRPRTNTIGAVARIRHQLLLAIHGYLSDNGFIWVNTPIITASDCEGAGELFRVSTLDMMNLPHTDGGSVDYGQDFFANEAFLTVSGQLNVESYCLAMSKVYTFGPTFRAENSNTSRHLAEFWMIEPEIAFADLNDLANFGEDFLKSIVAHVLEHCEDELNFFDKQLENGLLDKLNAVAQAAFEKMDYGEAIAILDRVKKSRFEFPVEWGLDLQSEHERYLTEKHVGRPVIVMNYPKDIKAFYMRLNDDDETVAALDVLAPGTGEIIGGSQREERLDVLDARLGASGLAEQLWWYRDLRRYGTVPHSGFGLGFERVLMYLTGVSNVRDVIPFPRTPRNAAF
ncbi:MAG: asparagine--tRNA ligase [Thiotrichales bacterium]|nr:asparagine--tRNA ligase [Thiotrichales bacterium]